jgi:hypothetical protein
MTDTDRPVIRDCEGLGVALVAGVWAIFAALLILILVIGDHTHIELVDDTQTTVTAATTAPPTPADIEEP